VGSLGEERCWEAYIQVIKDMYDGVMTSVRTKDGDTKYFPLTIGLHHGSILSSYLFTLVLDVFTEHVLKRAPRCVFFAYDIVLFGESKEELNRRLETWRQAIEI
jgi:hypothetical protein